MAGTCEVTKAAAPVNSVHGTMRQNVKLRAARMGTTREIVKRSDRMIKRKAHERRIARLRSTEVSIMVHLRIGKHHTRAALLNLVFWW